MFSLVKIKDILIISSYYNIVLYVSINTLQSFNQLIDRIETAPTLKFAHKQLACISKLVFFCGVQPPEIPKISIRDVLDNGGNIIREIHKFDKPIFLKDEVA